MPNAKHQPDVGLPARILHIIQIVHELEFATVKESQKRGEKSSHPFSVLRTRCRDPALPS